MFQIAEYIKIRTSLFFDSAKDYLKEKSVDALKSGKDRTAHLAERGWEKFNSIFYKANKKIEHIDRVFREGNYHSKPKPHLLAFAEAKKLKVDGGVSVAAADHMVGTTRQFISRSAWLTFFAVLTTKAVVWMGVVMGAAGYGLMARAYYRAKKSSQDIIREVNFAGQTVEGKRADLCRLHIAQTRIMNLAENFKRASLESTTDTIDNIISEVSEETKRVKVINAGRYKASPHRYEFSEPEIKLVSAEEEPVRVDLDHAQKVVSEFMQEWHVSAAQEKELMRQAVEQSEQRNAELIRRIEQLEAVIKSASDSSLQVGPEMPS